MDETKNNEYTNYRSQFNKSYGTVEEQNKRLNQFVRTDEGIKELNGDAEDDATYAHNEFSDWTDEERKSLTSDIADDEEDDEIEEAEKSAEAYAADNAIDINEEDHEEDEVDPVCEEYCQAKEESE